MRQEVRHACEHRQALAPTRPAVSSPELQSHAKRAGRVLSLIRQQNNRLRENQRDVLFHPFTHAHTLIRLGIVPNDYVYPDFVASDVNRKDADIVCPGIEGPSSSQIETGMVPVASQDAVLHVSPIEGKAHVRTSVFYCVDPFAVAEEGYSITSDASDVASRPSNFRQSRGEHVLRLRRPRLRSLAGSGVETFPRARLFRVNFVPQVLQVVAQVFGDLVAPIWILLQAAPDDPGEVTRQVRAMFRDQRRCVPEN